MPDVKRRRNVKEYRRSRRHKLEEPVIETSTLDMKPWPAVWFEDKSERLALLLPCTHLVTTRHSLGLKTVVIPVTVLTSLSLLHYKQATSGSYTHSSHHVKHVTRAQHPHSHFDNSAQFTNPIRSSMLEDSFDDLDDVLLYTTLLNLVLRENLGFAFCLCFH